MTGDNPDPYQVPREDGRSTGGTPWGQPAGGIPSYGQYGAGSDAYGQPTDVAPPATILTAVKLMYVGAALSALSLVLGLLSTDDVRAQLTADELGLSTADIDALVTVTIATVAVVGAIGVVLWLWMAVMNRKGRSWARVVATVLGGLNILFTLFAFSAGNAGLLNTLLNLLSIVLAAAILYLLYRPDSSAYYAARSGRP